jgi:hypothetical protein
MTTTYEFIPLSKGASFYVTFDDDLRPTAIDGKFLSEGARQRILCAAFLHPLAWWLNGFGNYFEIRKTGNGL